jgi:hypothetical protein
MTCKKIAIIFAVLWPLSLFYLTGDAFTKGYEQGYVEGRERALMDDQSLYKHCTAWWFNGNEPRAIKEINKYCERRIK